MLSPRLHLVWDCGTRDQLPPPKPCSEVVLELLSLQPQLRARCSPSFPGPGAIPSSLPLPSPGALSLCLNQGHNRSTPWLPKSSYLRCHQEIVLELTNFLWAESCLCCQVHRRHHCPQGGALPSVDAAVWTDGITQVGNREMSLHVSSVGLTFLRLCLGVWPTGSGVGWSSPGEKPVLPDGKRTHPSVMFPAQAAAQRVDPLVFPHQWSFTLSLSWLLQEGRDAEGPAAFGCFPSKPACQHSRRSIGLISHFPPLWQFSAQLFVALLILPTLLPSLLPSPSPCARLLVGELGKQQGLRLQPPFWAEIRGFVVFWTVN